MSVILVIDDNPNMAQLLQEMVELSGYKTEVAYSGLDGLDKIAEGAPDLILLDVSMPVMDGWEIYHKLRESSSVPVIFVTAHTSNEHKTKAAEIGADGFLDKNITPTELAQQIQFVLEERASKKRYIH